MEVALAAVADSANVSQEGKLNVHGIFDSLQAKEFPVTHPQMAFAFRLRMEHEDQAQTHRVQVRLIDMDGNELFSTGGTIEVGRIKPGQFGHTNQVFNIRGVQFERPGRYRFRVEVERADEPYDTVFQVLEVD